jgi:hypothetical protein
MRFLIPIAIFGGESIIFARVGGTSKEKSYHLVMTHIAMENPLKKWRFLAGNIIYKWAIYTMAMYAFPALFLRPADCGTLRDHLMTADVPSFVSACSHSCPACCFTHIYNHI